MSQFRSMLGKLARDVRGAALIETAVVAPALIMMCIGSFEVATMISKQSRLQSTAELATEIVVISNPDTNAERLAIQNELAASLPSSAAVQVAFRYRCATEEALTAAKPTGCEEKAVSTYLHVTLYDYYTPVWTSWGIGKPFEYEFIRTVQVS